MNSADCWKDLVIIWENCIDLVLKILVMVQSIFIFNILGSYDEW